jgi:hypothetical protein
MEVQQFKIENIIHDISNYSILIISKDYENTRSIIKDILKKLLENDFKKGKVISTTTKIEKYFNDIIDEENIHYEYDKNIINDLFKIENNDKNFLVLHDCMRSIFENIRSKYDKKFINDLLKLENNDENFLILQDCIRDMLGPYDFSYRGIDIIKKILTDNTNISPLIFTMQYLASMDIEIRTKFDYIFFSNEYGDNSKKTFYNTFGHMFKDYDEFKKTIDNHTCIVINNRSKSEAFYYDIEKN